MGGAQAETSPARTTTARRALSKSTGLAQLHPESHLYVGADDIRGRPLAGPDAERSALDRELALHRGGVGRPRPHKGDLDRLLNALQGERPARQITIGFRAADIRGVVFGLRKALEIEPFRLTDGLVHV